MYVDTCLLHTPGLGMIDCLVTMFVDTVYICVVARGVYCSMSG